ncbi:MAG TPA: ABC transporter permease [Polyangiaceae bacterium]|jgi:phospholipid/cholesterol/gamma-HCH transport system permease protein|nr:ABC transporter permease [Polyangiaceae bacterium]
MSSPSSSPDSNRPSLRPSVWPPPPPRGVVARIGDWVVRFLEHLGAVHNMLIGSVRAGFRRPMEGRAILAQMEALGVASVGIVVVTSIFIGMVMAVQFAFGLRKFGGMEYTGRVVALSFARELAPTFTAIIVGGRIGSGMAAEVGAMSVTEQIDAVRALGADPLKKLVWPRLLASTIVMPILSAFALVLGFSGAMLITDIEFHIPARFFLSTALSVVTMADFLAGMAKTPFFGAIIALVGCHFGMITKGGTVGVGNSTTRSVVTISIAILIADFFLTKLAIILWPTG